MNADKEAASNLTAVSYTGIVTFNDEDETVLTQVFENNEIEQLYTLRTRKGRQPIPLTDEGIIISEKLSEDLNIPLVIRFTLESKKGVRKKVQVSGICEMYIQHYAFISKPLYEKLFDTTLEDDTMFITCSTDDSTHLQKMLANDSHIDSISFYDVTLENFNQMVSTLNYIIIVLIVSSMALAFVVLGNLMNINISENKEKLQRSRYLVLERKKCSHMSIKKIMY